MKNAIILSGSGSTPQSFWHPYVKAELEKRGYEVWLPQLPGNDKPDINKTLPFIQRRWGGLPKKQLSSPIPQAAHLH